MQVPTASPFINAHVSLVDDDSFCVYSARTFIIILFPSEWLAILPCSALVGPLMTTEPMTLIRNKMTE